jgi:hypothetical protein
MIQFTLQGIEFIYWLKWLFYTLIFTPGFSVSPNSNLTHTRICLRRGKNLDIGFVLHSPNSFYEIAVRNRTLSVKNKK